MAIPVSLAAAAAGQRRPTIALQTNSVWWLCVVAIAMLGWTIRRYSVSELVLSADEAFSWRLSTRSLPDMLLDSARDTTPPGHLFTLTLWQALFGSTPLALRSFSALCGTLTVPVVYLLVLESQVRPRAPDATVTGPVRLGALLSAALTALHAGQIQIGYNARMYAPAALLAGLTAWLLLKALHDAPQRMRWWCGYGIASSAFLYMHPYAWYTLAAQLLFAGATIAREWRARPREAYEWAGGLILAAILVIALFSPWLPAFFAQVSRVQQGFTVQATISSSARHDFFQWLTGLQYRTGALRSLIASTLLIGIAWVSLRRNGGAVYLLVQASLPWMLTWVAETAAGMPLFQLRYLVLAQVHMIALLGVVFAQLPGVLLRIAWACVWSSVCLYGCVLYLASTSHAPPSIVAATKFLKVNYRAGDSILVTWAPELNLLRYYAHQIDFDEIDVRCPLAIFPPKGQPMHVASLHADDVWPSDYVPPSVKRLWTAGHMVPPREGWRLMGAHTFPDGRPSNGGPYYLALWKRAQ